MIDFEEMDRPIPPSADIAAALPAVLVPALWWRGVAMQRTESASMTSLERFIIELALTVGRAEPEEFFEITGLPAHLLPVAIRRLVASRILVPEADGYLPVLPGAELAARSKELREPREVYLDVVLLPLTDDLLVLDPRSSGLRDVERLRPRSVGNAAVPAGLTSTTLIDYIEGHLARGTAVGAANVTAVSRVPTESPLLSTDGWCPVYRCRGELRNVGESLVPAITFPGARKGEPVTLELPGADGLVRRWIKAVDAFDEPVNRSKVWDVVAGGRSPVPEFERDGLCRWTCNIPQATAECLAAMRRNLALPLGIAIRGEDTVVEIAIGLAGATPQAGEIIERDRMLTAAAQPGADIGQVSCSPENRERAWQLGFPGLVYALREAEDFAYA